MKVTEGTSKGPWDGPRPGFSQRGMDMLLKDYSVAMQRRELQRQKILAHETFFFS